MESETRQFLHVPHTRGRVLRILPLLVFIFIAYPISVSAIIATNSFVIGDIDLWPSAETLVGFVTTSWHDTPEGGSGKVFTPFVLVKALFVALFGQLAAGKIFLLVLLPASMISMFYASKIFTSSLLARYIAAFVYAFNPVTIGEFISTSPLLAFYAILPLVLFFLARLLESQTRDLRRILQFALISSCSVIILLDSFIILSGIFLAAGALYVFIHRRCARTVVGNILISIGVTAALLLPIIVGYYIPLSGLHENVETGIADPLRDVDYIYERADFLNLVKLAGNKGTGMSPLGYNAANQLWTVTGLVIPVIASYGLRHITSESPRRYLLVLLMLVALLLILFIWATKEKLTYSLFEAFPILFTYRNPRKLMFVISLAMSIMFAIGASQLFHRARLLARGKLLSVGSITIVMTLLLAYNWPIFTGDLGMSEARPTFPTEYEIPERYFTIANYVHDNLQYQDSRTIWLPMNLLTQYAVTGMDLNVYLLPSGNVLRGADPSYYVSLYRVMIDKKTEDWGVWLSAVNVRYIIVDKLSDQKGAPTLLNKWDTVYPTGDPSEYHALLKTQADIRLVVDKEEFAIFENTRYIPDVTLYDVAALEYLVGGDPEAASQYSTHVDSMKFTKRSSSEYSVEGINPKTLIAVVHNNYDPFWKSNDPQITAHFKAYNSSNGFIIKPGPVSGSIHYSYDQIYAITGIVAISTWVAAVCIAVLPRISIRSGVRKFPEPTSPF